MNSGSGSGRSEKLLNVVIGVVLLICVSIPAIWVYEHDAGNATTNMHVGFSVLEALLLLVALISVAALLAVRRQTTHDFAYTSALDHAANLSGIGYLHFFPDRKHWVANRVAQALLSRSSSQFTAPIEELLTRVHPADLDAVRGAVKSALESTDPIAGTLRLGGVDEGYTQVRYQGYRLKDGSLSINLVDVEEERQLRRLSELNEIRLHGALKAANAARLSLERDTGALQLPNLAGAMLQLTPVATIEDLISRIDETYQDDFRSRILRKEELIEPFDHLYPVRLQDEEERWIKFTVTNEGSKRLNLTLVDLTELKVTEFQQRDLIQQLEFASGLAGISIYEEYLEQRRLQPLVVSPDQSFEFPASDHLLLCVPSKYHPAIFDAQSTLGSAVEFPFTADSGEIFWLKYSVISEYQRAGEQRRLIILQDITARVKQHEALLESIAEMDIARKDLETRADRERQMFAVIGHELRTPAANIKMLLDEIQGDSQTSDIKTLNEQVEHLLDVLDDVRILVNPDRVYDSKTRPVNLRELVARAIASLAPLTQDYGLAVSFAADEGADLEYSANPQLLRQLTMNLVRNACFHSKGSTLTVLVRTRELDELNSEILMRFEDNGVGVDKGFQSKLFQPFHRADDQSAGMGLGLSICSTLAEKLNGTIHYEDGPVGGAVFVVKIMLERVTETVAVNSDESTDSATNADLDWSKLKVLFAEDNATISLLTNKMLTTKGVTVVSGMDGQKALDKFDIDSINVVLTDIFMPNMDGYALTKELRSRGFKGPVIGVSAAVVGEETELLLAAGADAVLSKPIKLSELETELKRLAERIN